MKMNISKWTVDHINADKIRIILDCAENFLLGRVLT